MKSKEEKTLLNENKHSASPLIPIHNRPPLTLGPHWERQGHQDYTLCSVGLYFLYTGFLGYVMFVSDSFRSSFKENAHKKDFLHKSILGLLKMTLEFSV